MDWSKKLIDYLNNNTVDVHDRTLVVWGTGNTSLLYYEGLKRLENEGFIISYYTGKNVNASVIGRKTFNGKPLICPEDVKNLKNPLVLITTPNFRYVNEIKSECEDFGVEARHIDEVVFKLHVKEIEECLKLFSNDRSREIYSEVALARAEGKNPNPNIVIGRSLFNIPEFFAAERDGRFIDCGAFVGDSIERYIMDREDSYAFVNKITAFEPDLNNFAALKTRIERLKKEWNFDDEMFTLYNAGVGGQTVEKILSEQKNGMSSKFTESGDGRKALIYALDDVMKESYSYLKADIESYEYQMLGGARKTIQSYKPNLAVCIYHNAVDFYQIPILVHDLYPDYKLMIRQHSFTVAETLLYAYED